MLKLMNIEDRVKTVDTSDVEYINKLLKNKLYNKYSNRVKNFRDYCHNTTIHGFKYLGEVGRTPAERVWWIVIMLLSVTLCCGFVYLNYKKWERSPILLTSSGKSEHVWQVPFPGVTVCFPSMVKKSVYDYSAMLTIYETNRTSMTEEELDNFNLVHNYCKRIQIPSSAKEMEFIEEFTYKLNDFIEDCSWQKQNAPCESLFTPQLTGIDANPCFTFNAFDKQDYFVYHKKHFRGYMSHGQRSTGWSLYKGYATSALNQYPRRALSEITFTLKTPTTDMSENCLNLRGYALALHHPADFPRKSIKFLASHKKIDITFKPEMVMTSKALVSYSPQERNCYFQNERKLAYFRVYTDSNCREECLSNISIAACGCTTFDMADFSKAPSCSYKEMNCLMSIHELFWAYRGNTESIIRDELFGDVFRDKIKHIIHIEKLRDPKNVACYCYPSCNTLHYKWNENEFDITNKNGEKSNSDGSTTITVRIEEYLFTPKERQKLFEFIDFFATCGGLLGLFTGISFVSVFEIIYFLTLRIWCNSVRSKKIGWVGN